MFSQNLTIGYSVVRNPNLLLVLTNSQPIINLLLIFRTFHKPQPKVFEGGESESGISFK
jgi:hypothetical protein